ncbi:DUF7351 domain-containing protein [Halovivax gelatinilyticus]|uniref:DUF7351 domain-containing protein n=1 Tax=Halovivax gelatinilyticus TaxID=2961597 RepID=UPI0020CA7DA8|nr:ArsR family transcriptional regulator [Halovivax gelatinilyticus]
MTRDREGRADREDAITAFEIVGNEIRARILYALGSSRDGTEPPPVVPFSELRRATDGDVDSSKFNYHLQRLVGRYVERTDEGYRMRPAGMLLYRTIRAGTITRDLSPRSIDTGIGCYRCDGTIVADSSYGEFWLTCDACDHFYDMVMVPPGAVGRGDDPDLLARLDARNRHERFAFGRGSCPLCANRVTPSIRDVDVYPYTDTELIDHHVHWACDHCGHRSYASVGMTVIDRPPVVSFFADRGVDLAAAPVWTREFAMTDRSVERLADGLSLTLTCGGDSMELFVDERLSVSVRD